MKSKWIKVAGVTAALIGIGATVQAIPIDGSIGFTGTFTQNGTPGDLTTATSMTIDSVAVLSATGSFFGAVTPPAFFATPIGVNSGIPPIIGELWSVVVGPRTYTFNVTSESQSLDSITQVNLLGNGIVTDDLGNAANGQWQLGFGVSGTGQNASFTWQSTTGTVAPDGGSTAMLLGAALSAIGLLRKKLLA